MKKSYEYREHAEECRMLLSGVTDPHQRQQMTKMIESWEALARDRDEFVGRHPELAKNMDARDLAKYGSRE